MSIDSLYVRLAQREAGLTSPYLKRMDMSAEALLMM